MKIMKHQSRNPLPTHTLRTKANFETSKRLLAALVNEGLVEATLRTDQAPSVVLQLQNNDKQVALDNGSNNRDVVLVSVSPHSSLNACTKTAIEWIDGEDLSLPILLRREIATATVQESHVSDPVMLFDFLGLRAGKNSGSYSLSSFLIPAVL